MILKFKKLSENAVLPTRGTSGSAGFDLYCAEEVIIGKNPEKISTGIAVEIPAGHVGYIHTRSSAALSGFNVSTTVIDSDYRGELFITASHNGQERVYRGMRIAQLVVHKLPAFTPQWSEKLSDTDRGSNGYGSTGR